MYATLTILMCLLVCFIHTEVRFPAIAIGNLVVNGRILQGFLKKCGMGARL